MRAIARDLFLLMGGRVPPIKSGAGRDDGEESKSESAVTDVASALILPFALRDQLHAEARRTFPRECCGLVEGVRRGNTIEAIRLHPTRNLAAARDRFEIDPAEHIRLLRALRGSGREIVGCYHSHPNGAAVPSPRDRAGAVEGDFVWLIATLNREDCEIAAYLYAAGDFRPLSIRAVA